MKDHLTKQETYNMNRLLRLYKEIRQVVCVPSEFFTLIHYQKYKTAMSEDIGCYRTILFYENIFPPIHKILQLRICFKRTTSVKFEHI